MKKLKAGRYFIGDPGYVIRDELWDEYCNKSFSDENKNGFFKVNNIDIFCSLTKYGDGLYKDNYDNWYPVDAGIIGATPIDKGITGLCNMSEYGVVVEFDKDVYCKDINEEGEIIIGDYIIYTDDMKE